MTKNLLTVLLICLSGQMTTQAQLKKIPSYDNVVYETNIKTLAIYPQPNNPNDPARTTYPPVLNMAGNIALIAEFDDLTAQFRNFRFKIFHANADWTPSTLSDIEFTYQYNDFTIDDYQPSFNTKVPYYHYRFELPKLKISGNYILAIYEDKRPAKLIATQRFMVYQQRVAVWPQVKLSMGIREQRSHQQIDFDLDHKGYDIVSPDYVKIVVRQNFRWDKTLTNLQPTQVRVFDSKIEYRPFDLSNNMTGGNEFRWFDTRMARGVGISVQNVKQQADQTIAYLRPDQPQSGKGTFLQNNDLNGQYVVLNSDTENSTNEADYINMIFTLNAPQLSDADVYVNGAFVGWQKNDLNRMTYNTQLAVYEASIFVKQGVVNYNYLVVNNGKADEIIMEGSYSATTNDYEIFVYHRPPASRADQLVGYRLVEFGR